MVFVLLSVARAKLLLHVTWPMFAAIPSFGASLLVVGAALPLCDIQRRNARACFLTFLGGRMNSIWGKG